MQLTKVYFGVDGMKLFKKFLWICLFHLFRCFNSKGIKLLCHFRADIPKCLQSLDGFCFFVFVAHLLLNRPSQCFKMLAECVGRINGSFTQVFVKSELLTKFLTTLYCLCLFALCLIDCAGCRKKLLYFLLWDKKNT